MQLLLVRHGNTFEEGAESVWIGSKTDLGLTAIGIHQAEALGSFLKKFRIPIAAIFTGPSTRHKQHGAILARALGRSESLNVVDDRLREIDYGAWEGKSSNELRQNGQGPALDAWDENAIWPIGANWGEDEQSLISRVDDYLASAEHLAGENTTLVGITSGGVLKYFKKRALQASTGNQEATFKVATGNVCSLYLQFTSWKILYWNVSPNEIPL